MIIPNDAPYDIHGTLCGGQAFRWRAAGDGWYDGVVFRNRIRLRQIDGGFEFACAPDSEALLAPKIADYLRIDEDMDAVYNALRGDPMLAEGARRHRGLRVLRQDPWECLISFICSANNSIPRISANVESMADAFGDPLPQPALPPGADGAAAESDIRCAFPTPRQLAAAGEQPLRDLGLGFRAKYVAAAAESVLAGRIADMYDKLRASDFEYALNELTQLNGVGDKIANCVILFSLDLPQAFPVDTWIVKAMRDWYPQFAPDDPKSKPTERQMRLMREWMQDRYGYFAGYANQYMFHHKRWLDLKSDAPE